MGWGCVPSLLFDLGPNYGGGNEDNGDLLLKVPWRHCCTQYPPPPIPAAGCHWPTTPSKTPGHSLASLGQGSSLLSPVNKVLFDPSKNLFPQSSLSSGGSVEGLMATSSKKAYAIPRSAAPRAPAPAAGHCWPVPPQETLKQFCLSLHGVSGSWCALGLFEPSEHLWRVWGLILHVILPLLPSCWSCCGFSALGRGVSPHSCSSTVQPLLQRHTAAALCACLCTQKVTNMLVLILMYSCISQTNTPLSSMSPLSYIFIYLWKTEPSLYSAPLNSIVVFVMVYVFCCSVFWFLWFIWIHVFSLFSNLILFVTFLYLWSNCYHGLEHSLLYLYLFMSFWTPVSDLSPPWDFINHCSSYDSCFQIYVLVFYLLLYIFWHIIIFLSSTWVMVYDSILAKFIHAYEFDWTGRYHIKIKTID